MNAIEDTPNTVTTSPATNLSRTQLPGHEPAPLRILHYLPEIRLEDGGVVRAVLDWCTVFADRGHRISLITCRGNDVPREWLKDSDHLPRAYVIKPLATPLKFMARKSVRMIRDLLKRTDVLHLHGPWLPGNRRIARLARECGVAYVVTAHGMLDDWSMRQRPWKKKAFMALAGRKFLDQAARIHCTAEGELSQAKKWFDNQTIVLPYLTDLTPFNTLPGPDAALKLLPVARRTDRKLLFLSRLHEKKGVDILIRAAALMRDAGTNFVLMIAGTGDPIYAQQMYDLVAELSLRDRVYFLGLVTGETKISVYQSADVFVLPTAQENFGLVLTEALACGTPVLTTTGTDIWAEVQAAGGMIADRTAEAFAAAATKLLDDPDDRKVRSARGREWVFANLAVDPLSRQYETFYRELCRC